MGHFSVSVSYILSDILFIKLNCTKSNFNLSKIPTYKHIIQYKADFFYKKEAFLLFLVKKYS